MFVYVQGAQSAKLIRLQYNTASERIGPLLRVEPHLILVRRLPGGDHMFDRMPRVTSVTSRQSGQVPVAYARLFSTVGRKYSVNDAFLRSGCPKCQIILITV